MRVLIAFILTLSFLSCKKEDISESPISAKSIPSNIRVNSSNYSLNLSWTGTNSFIKRVKIYRDTIGDPQKLYIETSSTNSFNDLFVGLKKYHYSVSFVYNDNTESSKSEVVSGIPIEPFNTNQPKNGEIGGINYAYWNFEKSTFYKISHDFTIYNEPTNNDGLYYQFYQGIINDTIGFYYGIQTSVMKPDGNNKKGIIFSRWNTRDISNYKLANNGWGQSAGYEGDFIGVRINYEWKPGRYNIELKKDSTDSRGDWYGLWIKNLSTQNSTYCGSIRFEKSSRSDGIKNGGITWTELYFKSNPNTPLPRWHVSTDEARADDTPASSVFVDYSQNTFVGFSNIFTSNKRDVHFLMGPTVLTYHPKGRLW